MTDRQHLAATFNGHQLTAVTEEPTTKRIVVDPSGKLFWMPPFHAGEAEESLLYRSGQRVSFHLNGAFRRGIIDVVMPDGTLLWVWLDDGAGRRLLSADDTTLLVEPEPVEDTPPPALPNGAGKPDTSAFC
ncbi:hypothetical protein [Paenarthrobacter histidinolovorans]|uniref:hypothetical protein n=1 Tax=Paenarthrobacter histidinolovorans TaxID=43664 RepID=UPI0016658E14|nr:hypothetical protein [Paenarthrobacter histidinolovorans]GGJ40576.1 hypothetical protein GCM10010052_42080 [Paenarthrobacter histidinolovorans]